MSRSPELVMSLGSARQHRVRLHYRDGRGDSLSDLINVQVMVPGNFEAMAAAIQAAAHLPLWLEDEELFLPSVTR